MNRRLRAPLVIGFTLLLALALRLYGLGAQPLVDGAGEERDQGEGAEHGHHPQAGLQRRVVEDLLHELRRVQHGGEEDRGHQEHR